MAAREVEIVEVVDYDGAWPSAFQREREVLIAAIGEYLRSHPGTAHEYADLKRELAGRFRFEREEYGGGKSSRSSGTNEL
jgi:GrpB-like predicted nucleotidyltransferase (UPF0157 family)